ncbi:hypothetical protein IQ268_07350 [Oculatella sp. LEGE 06141]|uniref:hypothetical protein n=1 Tax=Oculatella sp. LEGE 06141 TaxID=1828648 RepID=UPI00187EB022|nr:hypothetical protein [Oculatella sp. LEGE 06141]MBE9178403.1 hypothetical protein [Oculatella sp. LEGE 06141]
MRLKLYPAVIGVLTLGAVAFLASRLEFTVVEPGTLPNDPAIDAPRPSAVEPSLQRSPTAAPSVATTPAATPSVPPSPTATPADQDTALGSTSTATRQGKLRVSNTTNHPVRVALLPQASAAESSYGEPVHWDFAPGEGSQKGLILSLPDGELQLKTGDIVVIFAQDGSRRYWGPYVLGQTAMPTWNADTTEWQLLLQP